MIEFDSVNWCEDEKVSDTDNEMLTKKFTEEEVKIAVFSMEKNTAPGPDYLPVGFFQACWEIIKQDMMDMFADFFSWKSGYQQVQLWGYYPAAQIKRSQ